MAGVAKGTAVGVVHYRSSPGSGEQFVNFGGLPRAAMQGGQYPVLVNADQPAHDRAQVVAGLALRALGQDAGHECSALVGDGGSLGRAEGEGLAAALHR